MKVITLNTSGYEDGFVSISDLRERHLKKGIIGKEKNGNFHVYGEKGNYVIKNKTNGIENKKQTIVDIKKWLKENCI